MISKRISYLILFLLQFRYMNRPPRKTGIEFFWKWPLRFQPLDGHILEGLVLFTEVKINKEQQCPGHGCEKAPIAEIAKCDTSHCRLSIVEGPFSITWKRVKTHISSGCSSFSELRLEAQILRRKFLFAFLLKKKQHGHVLRRCYCFKTWSKQSLRAQWHTTITGKNDSFFLIIII